MQAEGTFEGQRGTYKVESLHPFEYGRISVLFEGSDLNGRRVCIKVFRDTPATPSYERPLDEFVRELRAQQTLKHSHILPILDFGEGTQENPSPFLILPLCKKGNLRQLMRSRDFIPLEEALPILQQVALAIDFAHQSGFVHGDIKPENILFSEDFSHPYLCDFGMSKYFSIMEKVTTASSYYGGGSSAYLSPEQIDQGKQTPSSDIYSFGIVAFEMLTGHLPFDVSVPPIKQMVLKIEGKLFDPKSINPKVSAATRDALLQALKVDSKDRPQTASELCQMFLRSRSLQNKEALRESAPHTASQWEKLVSAVMAALIIGVVLYLVIRNQPFADPNLVTVLRIVLSVASGILGATIPGFLNVQWKGGGFLIRAGGALALFVITYFASPNVILPFK